VHTTRQRFGPVDVLVNNASWPYFIELKDYPKDKWVSAFAVTVHGTFMMSQKALTDMISRGSGAIINISSSIAIGPGRGPYQDTVLYKMTNYGAGKAALERMTQGLAQEVYQYGITVAAVSPSMLVVTPHVVHLGQHRGVDKSFCEPPEMMAKAVLLLATEPLDKITGRVTYSQAILKEFGWIKEGRGFGIDIPGSGYSQQ
jgi:citronellol/citronellal dehydrogenase